MLEFIAVLLVSTIVVEAVVELVTKSVFFGFLREFLAAGESRTFKFFHKIVGCPYCCSVWSSLFVAIFVFSFSSIVLINNVVIDFVIFFLASHRLSNYLHDIHDKHFDKYFSATTGLKE
ncbi:MAG TPA: hypothetical protein ENI23_09685 [bacterium]|nr:hypothetical protein [bacterium]